VDKATIAARNVLKQDKLLRHDYRIFVDDGGDALQAYISSRRSGDVLSGMVLRTMDVLFHGGRLRGQLRRVVCIYL
jgi:hypothetical protein